MRGSSLFAAALAAAATVGCSGRDSSGGQLVRRTDLDVPAAWTPPTIMGRSFRPLLAPGMWACPGRYNDERATKLGQGLLPRPDWPLFRDCAIHVSALRYAAPRIMARMTKPETWRWEAGERRLDPKKPLEISEFFTENLTWVFDDNPKKEAPLLATIACGRPSFFLEKSYDENVAKFREWKRANTNFLAFVAQGELESDIGWYLTGIESVTNADVRARMAKEFPPPRNPHELVRFVAKTWDRVRGIHFGEERPWALSAGTYSFSHLHAANGAGGLFSECSASQPLARWQLAGAFLRGAARQFSIPFGLYAAHFYGGFTREGKYRFGENKWSRYPWSTSEPDKNDMHYPYMGVSRSLVDRENAYAYFIGASFLMPENDAGLYFVLGKDGRYRPSDYAKDLSDLYALSTGVDRGTLYAPVALLVSAGELCGHSIRGRFEQKGKGFWFDDVFSQHAFFHTLLPVNAPAELALRKAGKEGCLFNSPFGEFYDVLAADVGQPSADFTRALSAYKCAFLVGGLDRETTDVKGLEAYVRGGGTLFVSSDRVREGFVSEELAGLSFTDRTVASGKELVDGRGVRTDLGERYDLEVAVPRGARPLLKDERGTVAVWAHDVGKGRVVTVACWRMLPAEYRGVREGLSDLSPKTCARYEKIWQGIVSGERRFGIIRRLLETAQAETLPVAVRGNVQYGLNRTTDGWVLWLINNDGVTHYTYEPEEFDPNGNSSVAVDLRGLRGVSVVDLRSGETVSADESGKFSVRVDAGRWKMLKISGKGSL